MKRILTGLLAMIFALMALPALAGEKPLVIVGGVTQRLPAATSLQLVAPTTGNATINMPPGTAPSSPVDGDCWTTTLGLYCQINGSTVGPMGSGGGGGSGTVTTSGSPVSGNLAKFSASTVITNADLTGDCTTSGTLSVTCTKTSGTSFGTFATQNYATPPAIGGTTPAAGAFTTLSATGNLTTNVTGSTQCLQVNSSGMVSGSGINCGTTSTALTFNSSGGAASGTTFNGATAKTIDYSTVGAQPLDGDLTSIAGASSTDVLYYRQATNTWSPVTIGSNLTFSGGVLSAAGGTGSSLTTRLYLATSNVGTAASTSEQTLQSYTLPANTLANDGDEIKIVAAGTFAATTRSRTVKLYGSSGVVIMSLTGVTSSATLSWRFEVTITRRGSSSTLMTGVVRAGPNSGTTDTINLATNSASSSIDLTANNTISVTGTVGGTPVTNDIICNYLSVTQTSS
jgi:hypothetical protein